MVARTMSKRDRGPFKDRTLLGDSKMNRLRRWTELYTLGEVTRSGGMPYADVRKYSNFFMTEATRLDNLRYFMFPVLAKMVGGPSYE